MMHHIAYIVSAASIIGTIANSFKKRWCFIVWGITNAFWIVYNIYSNSYPQAFLYAFNLIMAIIGFIQRGTTRKYARTIKQINTALDIRLHKWQIEYIFADGKYRGEAEYGRLNGKTLANILKLCLSEGEPIIIRERNDFPFENFCEYAKEDMTTHHRRRYFVVRTKRIYERLKNKTDIPLREIIFK